MIKIPLALFQKARGDIQGQLRSKEEAIRGVVQ